MRKDAFPSTFPPRYRDRAPEPTVLGRSAGHRIPDAFRRRTRFETEAQAQHPPRPQEPPDRPWRASKVARAHCSGECAAASGIVSSTAEAKAGSARVSAALIWSATSMRRAEVGAVELLPGLSLRRTRSSTTNLPFCDGGRSTPPDYGHAPEVASAALHAWLRSHHVRRMAGKRAHHPRRRARRARANA
jgi:hypothetical protein